VVTKDRHHRSAVGLVDAIAGVHSVGSASPLDEGIERRDALTIDVERDQHLRLHQQLKEGGPSPSKDSQLDHISWLQGMRELNVAFDELTVLQQDEPLCRRPSCAQSHEVELGVTDSHLGVGEPLDQCSTRHG
jgi:hypothetical protein